MSEQEPKKTAYSKSRILQSARYTPQQKDVLRAILRDDATYTHGQVHDVLSHFLNKEVE